MLIFSWNVAGLSTTVHRIHEAYKPAKKSAHPSAALAEYFRRHGADIVCLQEHKIPRQQLSSRSEPRQASNVQGYESFWSCCVDEKRKGLNGVVTYCRSGSVVAADNAPLGSPELDNQGRCVMTDHGTFVLFNVYVPASGGQPLSYKMKFLNALRRAMQRARKQKPVILVGDLNIARAANDIYWKDRVIHVDDILEEEASKPSTELPQWKLDLTRHWNKIHAALQTKEAIATQTTNTHTGGKYDKYRLAVMVDGRRVWLGRHETSEEYCIHCYDFSSYSYYDEDLDEDIVAQEENAVGVGMLAELMSKIAGIEWDESTQRSIATSDASVRCRSPTRKWLETMLQEDGMVDTFRHFYPTAEARFTCWHQFTNRRYVNDGSRIDYTIVDQSLLQNVYKGDSISLRCCGEATEEECLTETAALRAATANGRFQPVSFEGGGITEATQEALDTQFGPAHTGMIYTPPSFSDHIAISLLMDDSCLQRNLTLNGKDAATRKAQPHKLQKSIASFFTEGAASTSSTATSKAGASGQRKMLFSSNGKKRTSSSLSSSSGKRAKQPAASKKPANTILHHFGKSK